MITCRSQFATFIRCRLDRVHVHGCKNTIDHHLTQQSFQKVIFLKLGG